MDRKFQTLFAIFITKQSNLRNRVNGTLFRASYYTYSHKNRLFNRQALIKTFAQLADFHTGIHIYRHWNNAAGAHSEYSCGFGPGIVHG
ncbi:hypothetical protein D3C77_341740 [compost metagenome]